mmetsp:Transcript_3923/g.5389  ORF Transcript_3923/g.5389 Transcript_3923/m.5389 type:complete len:244 (-) Transcript_3923:17-748(-)
MPSHAAREHHRSLSFGASSTMGVPRRTPTFLVTLRGREPKKLDRLRRAPAACSHLRSPFIPRTPANEFSKTCSRCTGETSKENPINANSSIDPRTTASIPLPNHICCSKGCWFGITSQGCIAPALPSFSPNPNPIAVAVAKIAPQYTPEFELIIKSRIRRDPATPTCGSPLMDKKLDCRHDVLCRRGVTHRQPESASSMPHSYCIVPTWQAPGCSSTARGHLGSAAFRLLLLPLLQMEIPFAF